MSSIQMVNLQFTIQKADTKDIHYLNGYIIFIPTVLIKTTISDAMIMTLVLPLFNCLVLTLKYIICTKYGLMGLNETAQ